MRIAIFGGSFDPLHIGHVEIVNKALNTLDIDKLFIVPTYLNPFKNNFYLDPATRFKLIKKVFYKFNNIEVCDYEIKQEGLSYSFDTVNYLKKLYNTSKIYLIIGEDNVENLHKWRNYDKLKDLVEFVIASRAGVKIKKAIEFKYLDINIDISSTQLRKNINLDYIPREIKDDILNLKRKGKSF